MTAHELARLLLKGPDNDVTCSVDVSQNEEVDPHAEGRVFGCEIHEVIMPRAEGAITICFDLESVNDAGFANIAYLAQKRSKKRSRR